MSDSDSAFQIGRLCTPGSPNTSSTPSCSSDSSRRTAPVAVVEAVPLTIVAPAPGGALERGPDSGRRPGGLERLGELLLGHRVHDLFLLFDLALVVLSVAQDAELTGLPAIGLEHDARDQLLALIEAEPLDVEVRHPDPPGVVIWVLAVVGVDAHGDLLQKDGDLGRVSHRPLEG